LTNRFSQPSFEVEKYSAFVDDLGFYVFALPPLPRFFPKALVVTVAHFPLRPAGLPLAVSREFL